MGIILVTEYMISWTDIWKAFEELLILLKLLFFLWINKAFLLFKSFIRFNDLIKKKTYFAVEVS